jgi:hypothetical protein
MKLYRLTRNGYYSRWINFPSMFMCKRDHFKMYIKTFVGTNGSAAILCFSLVVHEVTSHLFTSYVYRGVFSTLNYFYQIIMHTYNILIYSLQAHFGIMCHHQYIPIYYFMYPQQLLYAIFYKLLIV